MPATYEPINTTTLNSAASSITFSGIPSTYTDLVIVCNGTASGNTGLGLQFNSDTGTNYSGTFLEGSGTAASSERQTSVNYIRIAWNALWDTANPGMVLVNIQNYSNTTTKTLLARSDKSDRYTGATVGLWRSTSAVTSITITGVSNNIASGSTFTLYGIKSA